MTTNLLSILDSASIHHFTIYGHIPLEPSGMWRYKLFMVSGWIHIYWLLGGSLLKIVLLYNWEEKSRRKKNSEETEGKGKLQRSRRKDDGGDYKHTVKMTVTSEKRTVGCGSYKQDYGWPVKDK